MRKVVFIGNCQIQSIYHLYRRYASRSANETLHYVKSYDSIGPNDRRAIERADVIIEQVQDFKPKADLAGIASVGVRIGVPVVSCGFLWPFAGQPHPQNPTSPHFESGPYGAEMSDGFLNRLIKKSVDAEAAVNIYLDLDINKTVNLDRLYEMVIEKQQFRDELTDFRIAGLITQFFKSEPVFRTPYHPNLRIAMELAAQAFARLDVAADDIEYMRTTVKVTPFPKEELPVHPAVARHFGLRWATVERRYCFMNEGQFQFREFATRYMTCTWNPVLEEGLNGVRRNEFSQARTALLKGLEQSPQSSAGWRALSTIHAKMNEHSEAMAAISRALAADPDSASHHLHKAMLLQRDADDAAAEREYRVAAALEPFDSHYPGMLANYLSSKGRWAEARAIAEWGLVCDPRASKLHATVGYVTYQMGDPKAAEAAYLRAIDWAPHSAEPSIALAELYQRTGRATDAISVLRIALRRDPKSVRACGQLARLLDQLGENEEAARMWMELLAKNPADKHHHGQLINMLMQAGKIEEAVHAAKRAIVAFPNDIDFTLELATALERLGQLDAALELVGARVKVGAETPKLLIRYADLLMRKRESALAEEAYQQALAMAPNNAHALAQLGQVFDQQGRYDEAIAARETACRLEPTSAHRRAQLGHVLLSAGRLDAAEGTFRSVIAGEPNVAAFHIDLGHVLERAGRTGEAMEAAFRGVELDPGNARAHAYLAHLLFTQQQWSGSEEEYRRAAALAPYEPHWQVQLVRCLLAQNRTDDARVVADAAIHLDSDNALLRAYATEWPSEQVVGE